MVQQEEIEDLGADWGRQHARIKRSRRAVMGAPLIFSTPLFSPELVISHPVSVFRRMFRLPRVGLMVLHLSSPHSRTLVPVVRPSRAAATAAIVLNAVRLMLPLG